MIFELSWGSCSFENEIRDQAKRYSLVPHAGRVQIGLEMFPPDERDVWESAGRVVDAILATGLVEGIQCIDRIVMDRRQSVKGGKCRVFISTSHTQPEQDT